MRRCPLDSRVISLIIYNWVENAQWLQIVGGQEGLQRENRIKELEQEVARSTEVGLRLQRELADANAKLAAASGAPPANLKKHTPPADGVNIRLMPFYFTFLKISSLVL